MSGEPTTPSGWHERMYRSFEEVLATTGSGERVMLDGVCASLSPATPERSVFNSVIYERPEALADRLDELGRIYDEAGVGAWTVWVPESDPDSARLLEAAGHRHDANPTAMVLDLDRLADPGVDGLDWDAEATHEEVCSVNDRAYGYPDGTFARGIYADAEGPRFYRARLHGETACVIGVNEVGGDAGIWWVATLPEARGHRLSGRLMHVALTQSRERGCDISTLEATRLGRPIYEGLGYRAIGSIGMWERRRQDH